MIPFQFQYPQAMMKEMERGSIVSDALRRARMDISALPFEQAMRMDDNALMRVAVRHALDIVEENKANEGM